tara:strand:- start:12 stop:419 length:408 start_codon:yes stop_codon:yes gene_type:complete
MANTYTWTFPTLDRVASEGGKSDVVKVIHWIMEAVSDSDKDSNGNWLRAKRYGKVSVSQESGESFTDYNSITKDWCKDRVLSVLSAKNAEGQEVVDNLTKETRNKNREDEIKAQLDAIITEQKTPTILTGTPSGW